MSADLTIIIVSYNSLEDLKRCLPSIKKQEVSFLYNILIVDNHGSDGVADWVTYEYPDIIFISNLANTGYSGGNNLGIAGASSQWVFLLNPDTELHAGCLEQLMKTACKKPDAFINPKLLNADGSINACGNEMHYTGLTTCRGIYQQAEKYTKLEEIPLLSGAAIWCSKENISKLNGFNEKYFMYYEDTDLSLRARLSGFELYCEARAIVTHYYTLGMGASKLYYLERNRLFTLLTIFSKSTLLKLLPSLLLTELVTWAYSIKGILYIKYHFRVYQWLWENKEIITLIHNKNRSNVKCSDRDLLKDSTTSLPITQVVQTKVGKWLTYISTMLYQILRPRAI